MDQNETNGIIAYNLVIVGIWTYGIRVFRSKTVPSRGVQGRVVDSRTTFTTSIGDGRAVAILLFLLSRKLAALL